MKKHTIFLLTIGTTFMLAACGGKTEEEKKEESVSTSLNALQEFADKANEMKDKKAVDPVDFRKLKELLPEELSSLKRSKSAGEKSGAMGFTISRAEADYEGSDGESARVEILDTGGIAGVGTMALAAWAIADIDKESEDGYEKTTKLEGYKAFEKYNSKRKSGELNVLVADRYVVNVKGSNISVDQLKGILGDLDLNELADLK